MNNLHFESFYVDAHVKVLRDYGITIGNTNGHSWTRWELHVTQDTTHVKLTLWKQQVSSYIYLPLFLIFGFLLG